MEDIQRIHLFARSDKFDRLVDHRTDRKGGSTTCITVQLGQHHAVKIETFVEFLRRVDCILSGHGVDHEQGFIRLDSTLDCGDLFHHLLVDSQTTGGIDNHDIVAFCTCFADRVHRDLHRILVFEFHINRHSYLFADHAQLLDSGRTIHVAGCQQRLFIFLCLQQIRQLARKSRFTGTLQTGHQDDCRATLQIQIGCRSSHQFSQLVMHDLDHQLAGLNGCKHVLS